MIVAADIEVIVAKLQTDVSTTTGLALKKTACELDKVVAEATPYQLAGKPQTATEGRKRVQAPTSLANRRLYMLPMVVAGASIALSFAF